MSNKQFAERLNKALDDIDLPQHHDERVDGFAKLIKIPRYKADALLNGSIMPDASLLALIARELEVSDEWLKGL